MLYCYAIVSCLIAPADPGLGQQRTPADQGRVVEQLVRNLSSNSFQTRESASQKLREIGQPALRVLDASSTQRSEQGERADQIARLIRSDRLIASSRAAIGFDVQAARGLPMWDRFRVPNLSEEQRAAQLGEMILAVSSSGVLDTVPIFDGRYDNEVRSEVIKTIYRRLAECSFSYSERKHRVATALATLLFGGHPNAVLYGEDGLQLRTFLSNADAATLLHDPKRRPTIEWLVRNFVENLPDDGKVHALHTVLTHRLSNTAPLCRVVLDHSVSPDQLAQAAAALSLSGDVADVERIRPLLDRTHLIRSSSSSSGYVRLADVALYACIMLTKQSPEQYGIRRLPERTARGFDYTKALFSNRSQAHKRWRDWEQSSFRTPLPAPRDAIHGQRL